MQFPKQLTRTLHLPDATSFVPLTHRRTPSLQPVAVCVSQNVSASVCVSQRIEFVAHRTNLAIQSTCLLLLLRSPAPPHSSPLPPGGGSFKYPSISTMNLTIEHRWLLGVLFCALLIELASLSALPKKSSCGKNYAYARLVVWSAGRQFGRSIGWLGRIKLLRVMKLTRLTGQ